MTPAGFPHSDIPGSKPVCGSPRLIAAYHVLHRLLVPRHPPCALSSLTGISKVHSLCITQRLVFDCQRAFVAHARHAIALPPTGSGSQEGRDARSIVGGSPTGGPTLSRIWWR